MPYEVNAMHSSGEPKVIENNIRKAGMSAFRLSLALTALLALALIMTGCAGGASFEQISQDEARQIMETTDDYIIVDVRRADEFAEGHIPGAVNVPNETIEEEAGAALPNKEQTLLLYCRTGNRSKQAAQKLADLGYSNVYEFGGISEWTGDIEK